MADANHARMDVERERALVARSRSDASAFGELYDFYLPRLYGFVQRRVGDRTVSEDVTAMTFERALDAVRRGAFRNESFGGWLYRVAANAIVDHARRSRRVVRLDGAGDDAGSAGAAPEAADERALAAFSAALDRDELRRALVGLPEAHRRVLVLRFLDDLDTDELCTALGCSRGTLAVRLHRALRALRGAMAKAATDAA
jgi:RNA polymerase sigma-70 factor (ECF subfamily)